MAIVITQPSTITELVAVDGAFDEIMKGVKRHLEEEYKQSRIVGSNYKDVFLASIQLALQSAISYEQVKMEGQKLALEASKTENELLLIQAKKGATIAQIKLYDRQRKGYTDNAQSQALKILSDTYVVLKSKGGDVANNLPDQLTIKAFEETLKDHLETVGLDSISGFVRDDDGVPSGNGTPAPGKADDYVPSPTVPVDQAITIE